MPRRPLKDTMPLPDDGEQDFVGDAAPPQPADGGPMNRVAALTHAARELIDYISSTDVAELELQSGSIKIKIRRAGAIPPPAPIMMPMSSYAEAMLPSPAAATQSQAAAAAPHIEPVAHANAHAVVSPMVGTFYHAPSPKDKPYASEGQHVDKGQTIGLIEAMKMMNEIDADISGTVVKIVATNGQPVEYGQPLVLIEPDGE